MSKVLFPFLSGDDPMLKQVSCTKCGNDDFNIEAFKYDLFTKCKKCGDSRSFLSLISMYEDYLFAKKQKGFSTESQDGNQENKS